ncbi:hypothetical protein OGCDGJMD_01320 [Cyanobium usitatum str. Tous]|nr:hypothetical protein OGCDGJMD_01320 [Cyanobium usitatum str. Tous]
MGWSQLTAINTAKALTILLLLVLAAVIGVQDMRQVLYLSLHISYCLWWLLEQWLFPERARQLFNERVGVVSFGFALLFIGVLYSLPGLLAFLNPVPISQAAVALALVLFSFGSLINASADAQKTTAKAMGAGLVSDGGWPGERWHLAACAPCELPRRSADLPAAHRPEGKADGSEIPGIQRLAAAQLPAAARPLVSSTPTPQPAPISGGQNRNQMGFCTMSNAASTVRPGPNPKARQGPSRPAEVRSRSRMNKIVADDILPN